jgi:hypothetical protein
VLDAWEQADESGGHDDGGRSPSFREQARGLRRSGGCRRKRGGARIGMGRS